MADNQIAQRNYTQITASTTFGYLPGQVAPAKLVMCNASGAITITLPPVNSAVQAPPSLANPVVGADGGMEIIILNQTSNGITLAVQGSDTILGSPSLGTINNYIRLQSAPALGYWVKVGGQ